MWVSIATVQDCSRGFGGLEIKACSGFLVVPERRVAVLESVLGATPHEFESRILRHSPE